MDYVDRKTLNKHQIEYLEQALKASIQKLKFTGVSPNIANNKICQVALLSQGSFEISCIASIQKLKFTGIEPGISNNKICDAALISQGSYEISCIASILDTLQPTSKPMERKTKVFNALLNAGLIVTD